MTIDKDKLRELAADPKNGLKEICDGLGIADPTLYQHMGRDPELKRIYTEARASAKAARNGGAVEGKASARKPGKKAKKKAAKRAAPPRNARAKNGVSDELLRKIRHEFEHISLYESISDHFNEIREELNAATQ